MIDGRDTMKDNLVKEILYLDKQRRQETRNIASAEALLKDTHSRMHRWKHRTEMCRKLMDGLEEFSAGLDVLRDIEKYENGRPVERFIEDGVEG